MKTKPTTEDMIKGIDLHRPVKLTESEIELFDKICRFDILIKKSLVWIPSISELYETISKLVRIFNIERANTCYDAGFKSGFFIGSKISGEQTLNKLLQKIFDDS